MAINTSGGHPDMDYAAHISTYKGFLRLAEITIVGVVIILAGMAYFLV